jgi:selenocysteine lyase/cysteine desulfurase
MSIDRRTFLRQAATGAAGLATVTRLPGAVPAAPTGPAIGLPAFDDRDPERFWRAVRDQFPLTRQVTYFNTGGLGPASAPVLAKAAEVTRQLQEKSEHGHGLLAGAREVVARFLGARPEEIAFVRNATEGNGIVAAGLPLRAGDEVIFESHAHPGGSFPWLHEEKRRGIVTRIFEPDPRDPAGNVGRIAALITPRTRVVQVSHVTAPTGILLPVDAIARLCRERGIWFHIDGAQSAGMIPVDLAGLGCDSFATSGHKWLGAPHETGIFFVRRDRMDEVSPPLVGAYSGDLDMLPGDFKLTPTALRYEYGTRNAAAMLALAAAVRFQEAIGRDRIAARGRTLAARVRAGLQRLPGVEVLTPEPAALCASMISFRTAAVPFDQLFGRLMKDHAIRCRPVSEQKLNALRVSTHVFNTPAECDALIAGVAAVLGK